MKVFNKEIFYNLVYIQFSLDNFISGFNNKLKFMLFADLEWPVDDEALSSAMHLAIDQLLTLDPEQRPGIEGVQQMKLFHKIKWTEQLRELAPFVPQPTSSTDTAYFEGKNQNINALFVKIQWDIYFISARNTLQQWTVSNCELSKFLP